MKAKDENIDAKRSHFRSIAEFNISIYALEKLKFYDHFCNCNINSTYVPRQKIDEIKSSKKYARRFGYF